MPQQTMTPAEWRPHRVVVTGYYDGPTEGIIDFGDAFGVYCFKVVAFDFRREMRVLKLDRVASERLEPILRALSSALGPPQWPFWLPIWNFSDEETRRAVEQQVDDLCASGRTAMAALTDDTIEKCFAIRAIDEEREPAPSNWLALFP